MWNDLKKPVTIISLTIGLIGIIVGICAIKTRSISYQFMSPISKIFDSSNTSPSIQIFTGDSIPIKNDVWLLTGTIWNSGGLSIEKTDVMRPLTISVHDSLRIIDFKIVRREDPETSQFALIKESDQRLRVDWTYFEPDYGFEYQLIFEGNLNDISSNIGGVVFVDAVSIGGKIKGIRRFREVAHLHGPRIILDITKNCLFLLFGVASLFVEIKLISRRRKRGRKPGTTLIGFLIPSILIVLLSLSFFIHIFIEMSSSF